MPRCKEGKNELRQEEKQRTRNGRKYLRGPPTHYNPSLRRAQELALPMFRLLGQLSLSLHLIWEQHCPLGTLCSNWTQWQVACASVRPGAILAAGQRQQPLFLSPVESTYKLGVARRLEGGVFRLGCLDGRADWAELLGRTAPSQRVGPKA